MALPQSNPNPNPNPNSNSKPNSDVVTLTINGKEVRVPKGTTIFEAAKKADIFIPHYCYHPDLPIAGACRMCLCEIEKNPKLQISCNTKAEEGMVVVTQSDNVQHAVKSVLELHLINHPLDCPICDKAGECKLQDFYVDYGLYESRMKFEKVHKPKVVDIGTIVLDSERCILCSRCVRFTEHVTKTHELGIFNRGDRSVLQTVDNKPLHNDYTGNLADICPVGALTAKDFRFQMRVWFLEKVETICGMCARGCNTLVSLHPSTKKLYRIEPRRNPDVNKSWMCDEGRWSYHGAGDTHRLKVPLKKSASGKYFPITWLKVFEHIKNIFDQHGGGKTLVALSSSLTNEEAYDVIKSWKTFGINKWVQITGKEDEASQWGKKNLPWDGILKHKDLHANTLGVKKVIEYFGFPVITPHEKTIENIMRDVEAVFILGLDRKKNQGLLPLLRHLVEKVRHQQELFIFIHSGYELQQIVPPDIYEALEKSITLYAPHRTQFEKTGSWMNALGRLQRVEASIPEEDFNALDIHELVRMEPKDKDPSYRQHQKKYAKDIFNSFTSKEFVGQEIAWEDFPRLGMETKYKS